MDASFLGYFTTWHDTFLRSYVKQRLNNVWLYIVTFPESRYAKTSPYHTYCVAVGLGYLDHTPVLEWFSEQMEGLVKGNTVYCGRRKSIIHAKIGAVANQADRPEKSHTLQTALLGTYGRIASWAADIDHNILPDCNTCHKKRLERVSFAGLGSATMDRTCGRCCQWDLTLNSPALKRIKPPELYPKNTDDGAPPAHEGRAVGVKHIIPVKQSFPWLKYCVTMRHTMSTRVCGTRA